MNRSYCFLISISHPDACLDEYVILDLNDLPLFIKQYQDDYSVQFFDPLEVGIRRVNLKGGFDDGKSKKDAS